MFHCSILSGRPMLAFGLGQILERVTTSSRCYYFILFFHPSPCNQTLMSGTDQICKSHLYHKFNLNGDEPKDATSRGMKVKTQKEN